jgi:hypothetical protein
MAISDFRRKSKTDGGVISTTLDRLPPVGTV